MSTVAEDLDVVKARPKNRSCLCPTLIGNMVMLAGLSMLYQMQRFPLFCATTTSLPGTHWTYEQKLSSVAFAPLFMSYSWSCGGKTDTGVLHCCLHRPPLESGNQRKNLRMPQQPENSAVSSDSASVHFAELQLLPEDPPLLQSAVLTPPPTTSRITTSIFNKASPSIVLPWSSAGKVFNKDRPVDGGKFQFERHL